MAVPNIPGLYYFEDYVSGICDPSQLLTNVLAAVDLKPIGSAKSRRVAHYGRSYSYSNGKLGDAPVIPDLLDGLANDVDITAEITFDQLIVNEYKNGHAIAPHIDSRLFGPVIACISLGAPTKVVFERGCEKKTIDIATGSMYVMTGDARYLWTHSIRHSGAPRCSLTYRTVI